MSSILRPEVDHYTADPRMVIRPMADADLVPVMAIETASYPFPWTEGIFRDCLRVGYRCFVLMVTDELVGYGILSVAAGESHVLNLCVAPAHRRHGLGRLILAHLIEDARAAGADTLLLEVRPSNTAAIALYERMGFNEIGRRQAYYPAVGGKEDALILARILS